MPWISYSFYRCETLQIDGIEDPKHLSFLGVNEDLVSIVDLGDDELHKEISEENLPF